MIFFVILKIFVIKHKNKNNGLINIDNEKEICKKMKCEKLSLIL